ncbi:MAG: acetyl-CoA carboxylase biotin carboxylase subunit [Candidatus Aminicenantes bacterium]|nr:acetyl-CoA carboxylase biotin carboxylase subunit [Candidatus Aminicenantes bacterium]MDH5706341.1 acetyl-CoA carboxylase biotin carboxylase subunit [Candidatus Aminicenantes bacterium]
MLIANRGEIAVRIIRACRELGIVPVAVYSDADRKALHVRLAEEAYHIGESVPSKSYLNIERIIEVARKSGAEALHPGYGFLAENPELVKKCEKEGIVFIGPPPEPLEIMGNKTTSRKKMTKAGVPVIPGTLESLKGEKDLKEKAEGVGFPLLLKAAAGGGGKGLRLVRSQKDLVSAYRLAQSESKASFDDPSIYIEKYLDEPHHIEIQILADNFGNTVYLGERECSIQRRYQKVLEETPSPFIDDEMRRKMGEIAVKAAAAVNYRNAGTVEFMVDKNRNFYFLEMNTRLQVEHPITEMVTGIDLAKSQIEIAAGFPLSFSQEDIRPEGHSLECRIYAEDPDNDFMPSPGKIVHFHTPAGGLGVRDDNGVYEGYEVPLEYDPLLSKLITWGRTRDEAIHRMLRALSEYRVYGIKTTIPFFKRILLHPEFRAGDYNTHFISSLEKETDGSGPEDKEIALIAAGVKVYSERKSGTAPLPKRRGSSWKFQGKLQNFSNRL